MKCCAFFATLIGKQQTARIRRMKKNPGGRRNEPQKREEHMKIVVLDRSSVGEDVSVEAIKQFGEVDFYNSTPDELVAERIADANIVVANKSPMNESTMKDAKQVKMICQLSTGYDNVDIEYCKNRGIHVANARNYSTAAVAQHTVALALSVLENLPKFLCVFDAV